MRRFFIVILHIVFWVSTVFVVSRMFGIKTIEITETNLGVSEEITYDDHLIYATIVAAFCGALLVYTNIFYLLKRYFRDKKLLLYVLKLVVLIFFCLGLNLLINRVFVYELETIDHPLMYPSMGLHVSLILFFLACSFAYAFTLEWYKNERLKNQLVQEKLATELNFLKSQINPHFLFNTLNNLFSIAQKHKNEELEVGLGELSNLMRYMLYESNAEFVSLQKELTYLESFIQIQQLRLDEEDDFLVNLQVTGDTSSVKIAPMIFIPFVENAFKHGISIHHHSPIHIRIHVQEGIIDFLIRNRIYQEHDTHIDTSGIGLENVKRRLKLIYPHSHKLSIEETDQEYIVELKIDTYGKN